MALTLNDLSTLSLPIGLSNASLTVDPNEPDKMLVSLELPVAQVLDLLMTVGGEMPEDDEKLAAKRPSTDSLVNQAEERSSTDSVQSAASASAVVRPSRLVKRGLPPLAEKETEEHPKKMARTRLQPLATAPADPPAPQPAGIQRRVSCIRRVQSAPADPPAPQPAGIRKRCSASAPVAQVATVQSGPVTCSVEQKPADQKQGMSKVLRSRLRALRSVSG